MPEQTVGNAANAVGRLHQRIACNQFGSRRFASFVLGCLAPSPDDRALDIGSGLGAQLLPVAERVRRVVGVDISAELAAELRRQLSSPNASVVVGDMDNLIGIDIGAPFTLVYAVYSLYYSRAPGRVVRAVADLLDGPDARFVVVTPDVGNNAAWYADLEQIYELPPEAVRVPEICRRTILPAFHETFQSVTCDSFEDQVRFPDVQALMTYYDACAPYCRPDQRGMAMRHFAAKFERDGGYSITKRSIAVIGRPQ